MVEAILEVLPEVTARFELVVVDDGSTDATIEVADELARYYPQVTALRHAIPQGRAAALRTAMGRSTGDVLLLLDTPWGPGLDEIPRLWQAMEEYEIVLGRAGLPRGSRPSAEEPPNAPAPAGFEMGWRRALEPVVDFVTDQATLRAALCQHGLSWSEIAIGHGADRRARDEAPCEPCALAPQAHATGQTAGDPSGPKRPKYLDRARERTARE